jgi:hypothetical protein
VVLFRQLNRVEQLSRCAFSACQLDNACTKVMVGSHKPSDMLVLGALLADFSINNNPMDHLGLLQATISTARFGIARHMKRLCFSTFPLRTFLAYDVAIPLGLASSLYLLSVLLRSTSSS